MKYRTYLTICISLIFLIILGIVRPNTYESGIPSDVFWINKINWKSRFTIVLSGDSRTYRGLSPEAMKLFLPGQKICNFGFSGTGFERNYLDALPQLLDEQSRIKVIVLGITPLSLTPSACKNNGFLTVKNKNRLDLFISQKFDMFLHFFRPYDTEAFYTQLTGKGFRYYQHYNLNGWVASYRVPENQNISLPLYKGYFKNNYVTENICSYIFQWIIRMKSGGITVIGFRFPASSNMIDLENKQSGFDEQSFANRFIQAGGIWFYFPSGLYHTYDGSHLTKDSAIQLSHDLSEKIKDFIYL